MSSKAVSLSAANDRVFAAVCREHRALANKLADILQVCAGGIVSAEEIAGLLFDLHDALKEHFSNEEFRGFFREVTARAPHLMPEANKLCAEHLEMLHTARELAQFAIAGGGSHCWWHELNSRFLVFANQLQGHEHEEDSLLEQACKEDFGVND
jgi:hypothetical protein